MRDFLIAAVLALSVSGSVGAQSRQEMTVPRGTFLGFGLIANMAWDRCGQQGGDQCRAMIKKILQINADRVLACALSDKSCKAPPKITDLLYEILEAQ